MSINSIHVRDTLCPPRGEDIGCGDWPNHSGEPQSRAARLVKESIDHMLRHLDEPLRVSTLSSVTGFSNSYFFALFKSATGHAPKEFFIRLRMQRACKMLAVRTASIKEVAVALGYQDQFYFSRLFKAVIGIPPRDYRRKMTSTRQPTMPQDGCQSSQKNCSLESAFMNSFGLALEASA